MSPWRLHRMAHAACRILRLLGLRKLSYRLHDRTMPEHHAILWDLD